MDFIWWCIWVVLLFWIFALPFNIPGQRHRKDTPLDILNRRFAAGEISKEEFREKRDILLTP
ncbi:SHOCT domain-containing protein [Pedobacter jamesrossensis]|uniref:SHOCT domain-containing protein n=1 Tax=Pedobacter jamesrossensis TaxID=1908238 RepID=A0ABV8NLV6_9SPHI